jgi:hypothetical protein
MAAGRQTSNRKRRLGICSLITYLLLMEHIHLMESLLNRTKMVDQLGNLRAQTRC